MEPTATANPACRRTRAGRTPPARASDVAGWPRAGRRLGYKRTLPLLSVGNLAERRHNAKGWKADHAPSELPGGRRVMVAEVHWLLLWAHVRGDDAS